MMIKQLQTYVKKAAMRLNAERSIWQAQQWLAVMMAVVVAVLLLSRFFVWPYYINYMLISVAVLALVGIIWTFWRRVHRIEAMYKLDSYYAHNELVTSLSVKEPTQLVEALQQRALAQSDEAFSNFTQRPKNYFHKKAFIWLVILFVCAALLFLSPAPTQQQAKGIEQDAAVKEELVEKIAELAKKQQNPELEELLKELQAQLADKDIAEQALAELVKQQKELKQQNAPAELQQALTQTATETQAALSEMGKPIQKSLASAITGEQQAQNNNGGATSTTSTSGQSTTNSSGQSTSQNSNGQQSNGTTQNGQGQNNNGTGAGAGQGNGQGQGNSSGQGNGSGSGQGTGTGQGQGQGAGLGQGGRDLVAVADRFGQQNEQSIDGGETAEGEGIDSERGSVNAEAKEPIPYTAALAQYEGQYLQKTEQMQLPSDLQQVVQHYFSTIQQGGQTNE